MKMPFDFVVLEELFRPQVVPQFLCDLIENFDALRER